VDKARVGDRHAFDALRRIHARGLYGFVARRVGNANADDVVQDVWLACWTALPRFTGRARFKAWLYGIATHKCVDHVRGHMRDARNDEALRLEWANERDKYCDVDRRESVRRALAALPEPQREVVELYYYSELTLAEIAHALRRNLNTVKYQFYRAHALVAEELKREDTLAP
jgi:RNA polymerase sigma-70 factor (ECF subfamily)